MNSKQELWLKVSGWQQEIPTYPNTHKYVKDTVAIHINYNTEALTISQAYYGIPMPASKALEVKRIWHELKNE